MSTIPATIVCIASALNAFLKADKAASGVTSSVTLWSRLNPSYFVTERNITPEQIADKEAEIKPVCEGVEAIYENSYGSLVFWCFRFASAETCAWFKSRASKD